MSMFNRDPSKLYFELLINVQEAVNQNHMPGLPLLPMATLLVNVSTEAGETIADLKKHITVLNEKNGKLQWWVVALAVAALFATITQTAIAVITFKG